MLNVLSKGVHTIILIAHGPSDGMVIGQHVLKTAKLVFFVRETTPQQAAHSLWIPSEKVFRLAIKSLYSLYFDLNKKSSRWWCLRSMAVFKTRV